MTKAQERLQAMIDAAIARDRLQAAIDAAMKRAGVEPIKEQEAITSEQENLKREDIELAVPCEVYSRIVGYLRPVSNWNKAKQLEFRERKTFEKRLTDESNN